MVKMATERRRDLPLAPPDCCRLHAGIIEQCSGEAPGMNDVALPRQRR